MVEAKHVSGKNIFWSTLTVKSRGGKIFEFVHCPFEGRANMHHKIQPNWLTGRCCLAGGSKGQCRKSKIFLSLLLPMQVDQYIFFPETCFAPTISEPEFTVWTVLTHMLYRFFGSFGKVARFSLARSLDEWTMVKAQWDETIRAGRPAFGYVFPKVPR